MNNNILMNEKKFEISNLDVKNVENMYTNTLTGGTKMSYMNTIKWFFGVESLNEVTIAQMQKVTVEDANRYAHKLLDSGISKGTINQRLSAMQNFYKFLCRRDVGIMIYNPFSTDEGCIRFKNAQKTYSDKRTLTVDEIKAMLHCARQEKGIIGKRDLLVLELMCTTGMRRQEVANLRLGNVVRNSGEYYLSIIGKGDKPRIAKLSKEVVDVMNAYLRARKLENSTGETPLIVNHSSNGDVNKCIKHDTIYRIVKKYAELAGLDASTISPHCLRHTFATTAYNDLAVDKDHIQELMGHANPSTTQRYIKSAKMYQSTVNTDLGKLYNS